MHRDTRIVPAEFDRQLATQPAGSARDENDFIGQFQIHARLLSKAADGRWRIACGSFDGLSAIRYRRKAELVDTTLNHVTINSLFAHFDVAGAVRRR
jgi:hypothetical protein